MMWPPTLLPHQLSAAGWIHCDPPVEANQTSLLSSHGLPPETSWWMTCKYCNPCTKTLNTGIWGEQEFHPCRVTHKIYSVLPTQGMGKNCLQISNTKTVYSFQVFCHSEFIFGTGLEFLQKEINECIASVSHCFVFHCEIALPRLIVYSPQT